MAIKIYQNQQVKDFLIFILIILLVLGLGLLAINQGMGYFYKAKFLKTPCELCKELNPGYGQPNNNYIITNLPPLNITGINTNQLNP